MSTPRRYELSDFEWSIIQPLLPNKPRGKPRVDDRRVLNGIYWRLRTGIALGGHPRALWPGDDVLQPLPAMGEDRGLGSHLRSRVAGLRRRPADGRLVVGAGSSAWRQRQKGGPHATPAAARDHARAQCMGRSRGGLTTKIHALVDADGLPIALTLSEGQAHDGRSAAPMLGALGPGQTLIADRAYDSDVLRQTMTAQGAWANVKPISRRVNKPAFSPFLYRYRNLVERFFNKLKHFRAIATRYEKHASNYLAIIKLAATRIWLRAYESVT
jgi:transposase